MSGNKVTPDTSNRCNYTFKKGVNKGETCKTEAKAGSDKCKKHSSVRVPDALLPKKMIKETTADATDESDEEITEEPLEHLKNRGTGAGGAATNTSGLTFENKVSSEEHLLSLEFSKVIFNKNIKNGFYLWKRYPDDTNVFFLKKKGFNLYMKSKFNVDIEREPDEAFIVIDKEGNKKMFILEKKNQNRDGSVEDKIEAAYGIRFHYRYHATGFEVHYGFCLSKWFKRRFTKHKKYVSTKVQFQDEKIPYFFGDDIDYKQKLFSWVGVLF